MQLLKKILMVFLLSISLVSIQTNQPAIAKGTTDTTFSDVGNHWAKDTIQWALDRDMVTGYVNGEFKPNNTVTEAEFLTMLIRLYNPELMNADQGHWADPFYVFAQKVNYPVRGLTDIAQRNTSISRTRVAELISSADGVNYTGDDAIKYILVYGFAKGKLPGQTTVKSYVGTDLLTRAESLQFIKNLSEFGVGNLIERPREASDPNNIPDLQ
jgi:hypothetical protein